MPSGRIPWGREARRAVTALILGGLALGVAMPARADDARDAKELVGEAKATVETFAADSKIHESWRTLMREAHGLLIVPKIVRAGFILGGSGGTGVLVAKDRGSQKWVGPAFYTIGEASVGFQAGVDVSEVVIIARTERGFQRLLTTSAKLGTDLSASLGPVGGGAGTTLTADLIVYARSKGLYGGFSVEGSVVNVRESLNQAYYGTAVTPTDILVRKTVTNPQASDLLAAVAKLGG
jgi:lipid-binding SYLF domain-containing protein